jgi:putative membrane protein insertion efficiency factor
MRKFLLTLTLLPRNVLIAPVLLWRKAISPLYGDVCRYYPSCSSYGLQSLQNLGVLRGVPLTLWRILRCNPWSDGGIDDPKTAPAWIVVGKLGFVSPATEEKSR